jgi:hypothetical protein
LLDDDVPRVQDTCRFQQDHLGLFVRSSAMLDAAGHDDKLTQPKLDNPVPNLDAKATSPDQKHLFHIIVVVPPECPQHFDQLDELGYDLGLPVLGEPGKLFGCLAKNLTRVAPQSPNSPILTTAFA